MFKNIPVGKDCRSVQNYKKAFLNVPVGKNF